MTNDRFQKGQKVRFSKRPLSEVFLSHYTLAKEYIDVGKQYEIEHFFAGEPSQVELVGIPTMLFLSEMFEPIL